MHFAPTQPWWGGQLHLLPTEGLQGLGEHEAASVLGTVTYCCIFETEILRRLRNWLATAAAADCHDQGVLEPHTLTTVLEARARKGVTH